MSWHTEDSDESGQRDQLQYWCESHGHYELARKLAFVPETLLPQLVGKTPAVVLAILEEHGY